MNTEPVQGYREIAAVRHVERRDHDDTAQQRGKNEHREHNEDEQGGHEPQPAVEDLIDHSHEALAEHDEPVVLDEDIDAGNDEHDLDVLL